MTDEELLQEELLKIIEKAAREGATELKLSNNQLRQLPPEIKQLSQLPYLNLSHNQLKELPPEINQLTRLISLNLSHNQLSQLPPEMIKVLF